MKTPQQRLEQDLKEMAETYQMVLKKCPSNGCKPETIEVFNIQKQKDLDLISIIMDDYRKAVELLDKYGFLVKLVETKMSEL